MDRRDLENRRMVFAFNILNDRWKSCQKDTQLNSPVDISDHYGEYVHTVKSRRTVLLRVSD